LGDCPLLHKKAQVLEERNTNKNVELRLNKKSKELLQNKERSLQYFLDREANRRSRDR